MRANVLLSCVTHHFGVDNDVRVCVRVMYRCDLTAIIDER